MNKKGQMVGVGGFILLAITIIVGVILLQGSAQNVGDTTNTKQIANQSIATVVNGTAQYITNCRALSSVVIYNATGGTVTSGNYTLTDNVINPTDGALSVKILPDATAGWKSAWKVSGTCQPLTYIDDSGGRAMAALIIIMMALAIAAVAIIYAVKQQ